MRTQCCGTFYTAAGGLRCPDCPNTAGAYPFPFYIAPNTGWICPRCQTVNAPHIHQCLCNSFPAGPNCAVGAG